MVRSVAGNLPEQVKNNQSVNTAAGNGGQKMSQYSWFTVYDEPTGNLDSKTSADVMGLIKRTSYEFHQTVVMITHNNEIARLADRIVRIEDGKIVS